MLHMQSIKFHNKTNKTEFWVYPFCLVWIYVPRSTSHGGVAIAFEVKVTSLSNSRRPSRGDVYSISFVVEMILFCQKSQISGRQYIHVVSTSWRRMGAWWRNVTFFQHLQNTICLGAVVSDLDYGFQGQKSVLGLCQGFYRMQTKARGESSVGRLHYFDDYDLSWLDVRRILDYHTSFTRSVCLFCETSFAVHSSH
jgi:hypothetical protein